MSLAYGKVLRDLYAINQRNPVKLGLQNSLQLYEVLGRPLDNIPIIHVGGTNGKGSVSLKVSKCLEYAGLRTGLFISPHISSYRERIQIDSQLISEEDCIKEIPYLLNLCDSHKIPITFFELTTGLAFLQYKKYNCDAIVLEVGLGGRCDSTNIINPAVSVITSIQLDHCKILGDTIEKIAIEKAGIMKPNRPVIVGPGCPLHVLQQEAFKTGANLFQIDDLIPKSISRDLDYKRDIDLLNTDISLAVINLLKSRGDKIGTSLQKLNPADISRALSVRPPCRFENFTIKYYSKPIEIIFDIAHNVDAIAALVRKMKNKYPQRSIQVVLGMSADKDISNSLNELLQLVTPSEIHCTEAKHPRAMRTSDLRQLVDKIGGPSLNAHDGSIKDVLSKAIELSGGQPNGGVVLVCGSAFIMSEARAVAGITEPRDGNILYDLLGAGHSDMQELFVDKPGRVG